MKRRLCLTRSTRSDLAVTAKPQAKPAKSVSAQGKAAPPGSKAASGQASPPVQPKPAAVAKPGTGPRLRPNPPGQQVVLRRWVRPVYRHSQALRVARRRHKPNRRQLRRNLQAKYRWSCRFDRRRGAGEEGRSKARQGNAIWSCDRREVCCRLQQGTALWLCRR